jgi:uncharacterized protein (TIGR02588 family)
MVQSKSSAKRPASRNARAATSPKASEQPPPGTPALEWIAGALGAALTLFVLAVIGWEALNASEAKPPSIVAERLGVSQVAGGHLVEIRVANRGGQPAAQVMVEGELVSPGAEPEVSEASFDYIPDKSARRGGLFFKSDPAAGTLTLRAKGFVEP